MMQIPSNVLRFTTLFIAGSMLLSSLTGCGVYKDWKQKEETRLMQTTREAIAKEYAERKAEKEANKNWLQRHWTGVSIASIGVLTTAVVGMAAFMFFKWPHDGKQGEQGIQGIQGIPGIPGLAGKDGENGKDAVGSVPDKVIKQINKNTRGIKKNRGYIKKVNDNVHQNSTDIGGITGHILNHTTQILANKGSIGTLEKRMSVRRDKTDEVQTTASAAFQKGSEAAYIARNLEKRVINVEKVLKIEVNKE
jgi:hypothetical protein